MDTRPLQALAAASAMRLPRAAMGWIAGAPKSVDGLTLDVPTHFMLELMARAGQTGFGDDSVEETRYQFDGVGNGLGPAARAIGAIRDRSFAGPGGDVPVRIYSPVADPQGLPAVVYYHGGGWVVGNIETHDAVCRALCERAGCVVVSVDYRLAPENRFPAAADDAEAAFDWVARDAELLGIDARRIAVAGDSAGGNLAAVVAQQRKNAEVAPCYQLLIYPVTDLACDSHSYDAFSSGFLLTKKGMLWFREHYLGGADLIDDPRVSPLRAEDVSGTAPASVFTAGFDPLRDEGKAYAEKLSAAGVATSYRCYEHTIHGCFTLGGVLPQGADLMDDAVGALRAEFARLRAAA